MSGLALTASWSRLAPISRHDGEQPVRSFAVTDLLEDGPGHPDDLRAVLRRSGDHQARASRIQVRAVVQCFGPDPGREREPDFRLALDQGDGSLIAAASPPQRDDLLDPGIRRASDLQLCEPVPVGGHDLHHPAAPVRSACGRIRLPEGPD